MFKKLGHHLLNVQEALFCCTSLETYLSKKGHTWIGKDIPFYCTGSKIIVVEIFKNIYYFYKNKNN